MLMGAPAFFEPCQQKDVADCAIASTAMILGIPYAEVERVTLELLPNAKTSGMSVREVQRVVKKLVNRTLDSVLPKTVNLEEETGILFVNVPQSYHAVVLFQGVVYDPQTGKVWNLHAYKAERKATPIRLLRP